MNVSIVEVAKRAGVSIATVSKVLNRTEGARVGAGTRERVIRVAAESGYQPNKMARSMVSGRSNTIGLMVSGFENPFFVAVMEALERKVTASGYQVMLDVAPSTRGTFYQHGMIRGWPVDGVLMWAFQNQNASQFLGPVADDLPVVYLGYSRSDGSDWVSFDHYKAGRIAAGHLIDRGHDQITFVTPHIHDDGEPMDERFFGCRDECLERGVVCNVYAMPIHQATRAAAFQTGQVLAKIDAASRPRALVCNNDLLALGVMHGLRSMGIVVPRDVAIVGFDGIDEGKYQDVSLTTVESPVEELAEHAAKRLIERLSGASGETVTQMIAPRLRVGGSTVHKEIL
ncbi:MAG: LacI family DNA-binding transcriptional regulator [Capsulimonadaceae bacterium]|nr:LacI family DNA-binding transcriptional regulator [Capsulimonadaceae bacterium]